MKRKTNYLVVILFLLAGCAAAAGTWQNMTPKGRAAIALSVYNNAYDSYLTEVKTPDLSKQSKNLLKKKKKALIALHATLKTYTDYIQSGHVPPADIDATLQSLLKPFWRIK